jgi:hypothetical protein
MDCTISRPLNEIPRPIRPKRTTEKVMIPKPPIWKRTSVTIWPAKERSFPISIEARPVTQTAEAEEKRASTKLRWPRPAANGSQSRIAPAMISSAKLRMKIRGGVKRCDIDVLVRQRISTMPFTRQAPPPAGPGDFPFQFPSVRSFRLRRRTAIRIAAPTVIAESATLKAGQ